jgi:hypothetical protein
VEHLVHQGPAFHHVPHQHEQRDGQQRVVGHGPEGALHHQVEHLVVPEVHGRVVKRREAEQHAQAHEGEGGGKAHHDHDHDEAEHGQAQCCVAHW